MSRPINRTTAPSSPSSSPSTAPSMPRSPACASPATRSISTITPASIRAWAPPTSSRSFRSRGRRWKIASSSPARWATASAANSAFQFSYMSVPPARPDRENLADVRRGEFEGIRDEMKCRRRQPRPRLRSAKQIHVHRRRRRHRRAALPRRVQRLPRPGERTCPSPKRSRKPSAARPADCAT